MAKLEISIGQNPDRTPVIFVKGSNPKKVVEAYLEVIRGLHTETMFKKEKK